MENNNEFPSDSIITIEQALKSMHFLTRLKLDSGAEYVFFDNGDIFQIIDDNKLKKVNDVIDKDGALKNKILARFDAQYGSDVVIDER